MTTPILCPNSVTISSVSPCYLPKNRTYPIMTKRKEWVLTGTPTVDNMTEVGRKYSKMGMMKMNMAERASKIARLVADGRMAADAASSLLGKNYRIEIKPAAVLVWSISGAFYVARASKNQVSTL